MFDQRSLDKALAAIGVPKKGKLTYAPAGASKNLTWTLGFRLLGVYRWEIDGALRVSHATATPFARMCLSKLAGRWWSDAVARLPNLQAGTNFPVNNLTNWSKFHSLSIKNLTAQESADRVARDVESYVLPFIASIQDDDAYLDHLIADQMPMNWLFSQPLERFAEAVKLSVTCGRDVNAAIAALERERAFAAGQLSDCELDQYSAAVVRAAASV